MKLTRLLTQNLDNPIGLGCTKPCFCYTLQSEERLSLIHISEPTRP